MGLLDLRSLEETTAEAVTGTGGVEYLYDDVTGDLLVDDVTLDALYAEDAVLGRVSFAKPSIAASGSETLSGTAGLTIGHPALAASGLETLTGTGALVIAHPALAAEGSAGTISVDGTGALVIGPPLIGATGIGGVVETPATAPRGVTIRAAQPYVIHVTGTGAVAFGFEVHGEGTVNDDELALLLAA